MNDADKPRVDVLKAALEDHYAMRGAAAGMRRALDGSLDMEVEAGRLSPRRDERGAPVNIELTRAVANGVHEGIRELLDDQELMERFWTAGYAHLTRQAGNGASQWVGKRILYAAIAALFVWSMSWLVKNGALK